MVALESSIKIATLDPSGRFFKLQIEYQSDLFDTTPLSILTWIGPNVWPLAFCPGDNEVSLILINVETPTIFPRDEVSLIWIRNLSVPSVVLSLDTVLTTLPVLFVIVQIPVKVLSVKSSSLIVQST